MFTLGAVSCGYLRRQRSVQPIGRKLLSVSLSPSNLHKCTQAASGKRRGSDGYCLLKNTRSTQTRQTMSLTGSWTYWHWEVMTGKEFAFMAVLNSTWVCCKRQVEMLLANNPCTKRRWLLKSCFSDLCVWSIMHGMYDSYNAWMQECA